MTIQLLTQSLEEVACSGQQQVGGLSRRQLHLGSAGGWELQGAEAAANRSGQALRSLEGSEGLPKHALETVLWTVCIGKSQYLKKIAE